MYNRARFVILENRAAFRDGEAARAIYDDIFVPMGGRYAGWISHSRNGPRPAHFYMFDNPAPAFLAGLIQLVREQKVNGFITRARWSENEIEYGLEQIMLDIASALKTRTITGPLDSQDATRCWEGIKVLEAIAMLDTL